MSQPFFVIYKHVCSRWSHGQCKWSFLTACLQQILYIWDRRLFYTLGVPAGRKYWNHVPGESLCYSEHEINKLTQYIMTFDLYDCVLLMSVRMESCRPHKKTSFNSIGTLACLSPKRPVEKGVHARLLLSNGMVYFDVNFMFELNLILFMTRH